MFSYPCGAFDGFKALENDLTKAVDKYSCELLLGMVVLIHIFERVKRSTIKDRRLEGLY
jgi:hypothetical protein